MTPAGVPGQPGGRSIITRIVCADGDEGYYALLEAPTFEALAGHGITLDWYNGTPASEDEWLARVGDAHGVVLLWDISDRVLTESPNLRAVSWVGTGVGTFVNVPLATSLGICVCNTPGYGENAVAEHALGLMLALARNTVALDAALRAGNWPREEVRGVELAGKTLGVVGLGGIGSRVARMCSALGMHVLAWTQHPTAERLRNARATWAELPDLFSRSDVVSLHLAHNKETTGIISGDLLTRMQPNAFLVNTARAEIVDSAALLALLSDGRIAGAALDVFDHEPIGPDNPFLALPNAILTPHVGFRTPEATRRSITIAVENLLGYFTGRPRNVVNPESLAPR